MSNSQKKAPANALRDRGEAALRALSYGEAEKFLEKALEKNPEDARTLMLLGDLAALKYQNPIQSLGLYMLAVQADSEGIEAKKRFITLSGEIAAMTQFNPLVKTCLTECLKTSDLDCTDAQKMWYLTFSVDPAFSAMFRMTQKDGGPAFDRAAFDACADFRALLDPFFTLAIERFIVYSQVFEDFLTCLRRALLDDLDAGKKRFEADFTRLAAALARYCFATEYVFAVSDEETRKIPELRTRLEAADGSEMEIALLACYVPLHRLTNAKKIEEMHDSSTLINGLVRLQISDYFSLLKKQDEIPALTTIGAGVSSAVREQYEEFPYPQWSTLRDLLPTDLFWTMRGKKAKILVAGGGTGNEAANIARALPDADILSIDLSRASLAYAAQKAEAFGLPNITFRHADILLLDPEGEKYDIVTSTGVLVCMDDPMQGWRILTRLMKPGGLMRIGLYSEAARVSVVKARQAIAEKNIPGTADGMRAFRTAIDSHIGKEAADVLRRGCTDYYHMSMLKDLLFHVKEHRFTIPQIRAALDELGLAFITFIVPVSTLARYQAEYPNDPGAGSLDNWEAFEKKHPDAFLYMYQFWCKKK